MPKTFRRSAAVAVAALVLAACGDDDATDATAPDAGTGCPTEGDELEDAKLYIEHNATDEDTGVHALLGGEPWRSLCVVGPDGTLLDVTPRGALGELGLSDLFFESNEPENDELPIDELLADFPEGDYAVGAIGLEGESYNGTARLTHDIPAEPEITSPDLFEEPEEAEAGEPVDGLTIQWEAVTETIDGSDVELSAYELIITDEEFEYADGRAKPVFDVILAPDVTSLDVPSGFLQPDTVYEVEVIAIETSGNQTIGLGFFRTAP